MAEDIVLRREITTLAQLMEAPAIIQRNLDALLAVRANDLHKKFVAAFMEAINDPNLGSEPALMSLAESFSDPRKWLSYYMGRSEAIEIVQHMTDEEVALEIAEYRAREEEATREFGMSFAGIDAAFRLMSGELDEEAFDSPGEGEG